jgi:hypothetical protein
MKGLATVQISMKKLRRAAQYLPIDGVLLDVEKTEKNHGKPQSI